MRYVETSGKTVDDAITAALLELGLPSEQVDIEILQESSKGVLGIFGAKEARIRATAKAVPVEEELFSEKVEEPVKEEVKPVQQEASYVMDTLVEDRLAAARAKAEAQAQAEAAKEPVEYSEDAKIAQEAAIEFLIPVLKKMGVEAEIVGEMEEADVLKLDIQGQGLGVIIGKRFSAVSDSIDRQ